jgi:hypothetical protein
MSESEAKPTSAGTKALASTIAKLVVIAVFLVIWSAVYDVTNAHGSASARAVRFTRPCDLFPGIIQPWTAGIYLVGGVALPLLPFLYNWRWTGIRFVLACYTIAAVLAFAAYWLCPVVMDRPTFDGPDVGRRLMRWIQAMDQPANCCPSSHALFAVLGAVLVSHGRVAWLVPAATWVLAVAVCATTITTGQHYFADVAAGATVAAAAYIVARALGFSPRAAPPPGPPSRRG